MFIPILVLLAAYIIGAIPFGFLLVKLKSGDDIRSSGSGNIGATNVLRTSGPLAGVITLLLDIAKGFLAVWLAARLTGGDTFWTSAAALAVMAGHAYPVFLNFRGGKAVASFIGAFAYLAPVPMAAVAVLFIGIVASTRFISLGSILGAGTFPLAVWLILHPPWPPMAASIMAGAFIVYRHHANLERLHRGSEHVFSLGGRKA